MFFSELLKNKTKENAKRTLKTYRNFLRIAGEEYSPKVTATYSLEPKSAPSSPSRQIENMVLRRVSAQQELEHIADAINRLSDANLSQILVERYCRLRFKQDKEIYPALGYSSSEYYRLLDQALYEFAEAYKGGELLAFNLGDIQEICGS
jgi:phage transcriptional regulator, arpU family|nr:MAG TPA: transcriptional regulator [Caudoviricetes sp.]